MRINFIPKPENAVVPEMQLTWDNIANVPFGAVTSVTAWNTFFNLPTKGTAFTSVEVTGNMVRLMGGWSITLKTNIFRDSIHLVAIEDISGCITAAEEYAFFLCSANIIYLPGLLTAGTACFFACPTIYITCPNIVSAESLCFGNSNMPNIYLPFLEYVGTSCFQDCHNTTVFDLPAATDIEYYAFLRCYAVEAFNLPSLVHLGRGTDNSSIFLSIAGQTITLVVPAALMTCRNGGPDLDIVYLQSGNTVTVVEV